MSEEDKLVSAIISAGEDEAEYSTEVHYNYYGDRGVVDLYQSSYVDHVIEVKSESAVYSATGANEIIRQFNRMKGYFYDGSNHERTGTAIFELCFTATEKNMKHIEENADLYKSALSLENRVDRGVCEQVTLGSAIHPNQRFLMFNNAKFDYRDYSLNQRASVPFCKKLKRQLDVSEND